MRAALIVVVALATLAVAAGAGAQNFGTPAERFRVEWQAAPRADGGTAITGWIHNDHLLAANHIRLRIDTLDAAGQTVATAFWWAPGDVATGGRLPFSARVRTAGPAYRVSVASFDLFAPSHP